jgi:murein DD-endopeptidase MepM/ murein hydrolase activator NlpD
MRWSKRRLWSVKQLMTVGAVSGFLLLLTFVIGLRHLQGAAGQASPSLDSGAALDEGLSPARGPATKAVSPAENLDPHPSELLFPVPAVSPATMADSFLDRRGARVHHAVDILAPRHADVVAVADGTVARIMTSTAGGLSVYQRSSDQNFIYYYAHLQTYAPGLAEGASVRRGQVLGFVGTTGNAPPNTPHLHFAIARVEAKDRWWGGAPIDPYPIWRRR